MYKSSLEISGNKEIFIDNYKKIVKYNQEEVEILCNDITINILGRNLLIEYYNNFEMRISGRVIGINFKE